MDCRRARACTAPRACTDALQNVRIGEGAGAMLSEAGNESCSGGWDLHTRSCYTLIDRQCYTSGHTYQKWSWGGLSGRKKKRTKEEILQGWRNQINTEESEKDQMHQKDSLLHPGGPQTLCALLKTFIPRRSSQTGVVSVLEHVFIKPHLLFALVFRNHP